MRTRERSCPRCTKNCTCSHCRVSISGKRKGECDEDDALEAEYEALLAKEREANGGAANSRGSSCHYCRQKKSLYVECNKSRFHRWCASCVKNGFGIDFGELLRNKDKAWPHGCPICQATCTCSLCKRRAVAQLTKGGDAALAGMLMGFSTTEDTSKTSAKKQKQQRSPSASRPKKRAARTEATVNAGSSSASSKPAMTAAAMMHDRCRPSSVPARQPLPPSARESFPIDALSAEDSESGDSMDLDLDDNSKLPHLMTVASFNSIMSSTKRQQHDQLSGPSGHLGGSDVAHATAVGDPATDASTLLDMLAFACEPDVTEALSSSPARDVQIAPTAFFAAAAAQSSAKAAFRALAHSPKRTISSVETVPDSPTDSRQAATDASGAASEQQPLPLPTPLPVPAAPAMRTTDPEGSPCSSVGSDSPPFSPSLAPDGKTDNGNHAHPGAAGSEASLPMDELQLPRSPRSLYPAAKYHRSGSTFGDSATNSLTTGRDLRDDLKIADGAGVAMTMLARTATSSSIMPTASPRAAAVAQDLVLSGFLTMHTESVGAAFVRGTERAKEGAKRCEGRCSPRAGSAGGGLLQELNGVTQLSPSGRTAHLGERLGPGAC